MFSLIREFWQIVMDQGIGFFFFFALFYVYNLFSCFKYWMQMCLRSSTVNLCVFRTGIRGDGRCLFRSVVHGASLRAGKPSPSDSLQRELADELRSKVHDELKFTEFRRILMLFCHTISYVKWWYDLDRWSMNSSDGGRTPNGKFRKDLTNLYLDNFCLDADLNCFENHFQSLVEICFEFICRFLEDDFETYVVQMRQPHIWGGEPELLMSSHVLR